MSLTPSTMLPLGTVAPSFSLPDAVSGKIVDLQEVKGERATLVMFICNHCPYVKHVQSELARLGNDYGTRGVGVVAISSNDVANYPDDSPAHMKVLASKLGFRFPYLYDESQDVAKAYQAACTPDFFVFDGSLKCAYRGQLDGSRPGNKVAVDGADLRAALDAILAGRPVDSDQKPSVGCNIKWKS